MQSSSSSKSKKLEGTVVFKSYKVLQQIGSGAFGEIYKAQNQNEEGDFFAIKAEPINTRHPQLLFQAKLYKYLHSDSLIVGVPKVYAAGIENGYNLMMMDLLGKSLEDIFVARNKKFSLRTVVMVGLQMVQRLQYLHSRGFIHRDMKPDNMLVGPKLKEHIIYLIDMGLSKKYINKEKQHIPFREGKELTGTARYASIATHKGMEQSRRDDLESLGYVLMYFLRGILPWQNMKANTAKAKYEMIMNKKISTPLEVLCKDYPVQLVNFISYARNLKFEETPNYDYLKDLLKKIGEEKGFRLDYKYDWST